VGENFTTLELEDRRLNERAIIGMFKSGSAKHCQKFSVGNSTSREPMSFLPKWNSSSVIEPHCQMTAENVAAQSGAMRWRHDFSIMAVLRRKKEVAAQLVEQGTV